MWTRTQLKGKAKTCLGRYYWWAFLVSLIFTIINGIFNFTRGGAAPWGYGTISGIFANPGMVGSGAAQVGRMVMMAVTGTFIVAAVIAIAVGIFVTPVIEVGNNRFYMESRAAGASTGVGRLFWGFRNNYLSIVKTQFIKNLITAVPVILYAIVTALMGAFSHHRMFFGPRFAVTGLLGVVTFCVSVYLEYSFWAVPYILSENPDMPSMEALSLSRRLMEGQKFNAFVLGLSFLGWYFLGMLLFGIGSFFVNPYAEATYAELYAVLRQESNVPLNGFGMPDPFNRGPWQGMPDGYWA